MRILKSMFKIPPLPLCEQITLLDASFAHCSSTLLRGGRGGKHKIVQIAVFPIIFVTDCSLKDFGGANDLSLLASWASFNKDNGDCYHIYINYLTQHKEMLEPPYQSETPEF